MLGVLAPQMTPAEVPLIRQHLGYSSPIACQLARSRDSAPALATRLAAGCFPHRRARAKSTGWIEFEIDPSEFSAWIAPGLPPTLPEPPTLPTPASGISLPQYAHARAWTWYALGNQTGMLGQPVVIPWERLWTDPSPVRVGLLAALMDAADGAAEPRGNWAIATATQLATAVLATQKATSLWGDCRRQDLGLARAQLGAIGVAGAVLTWLLEVELGISAPHHL